MPLDCRNYLNLVKLLLIHVKSRLPVALNAPKMGGVLACFKKSIKRTEGFRRNNHAILPRLNEWDIRKNPLAVVSVRLAIGFGDILGITVNRAKKLLISI